MHGAFVCMYKQCKVCAATKVPGECPRATHNTSAGKGEWKRRKRKKRGTKVVERKSEAREDF